MKKVIGLTGGIASGKSTVVDFLISLGYQVIDADKVVRELQAPQGRLYEAILKHFGSDFIDETGQLNRAKLGALVFENREQREKLSLLQDEIIRKELYHRRDQFLGRENADVNAERDFRENTDEKPREIADVNSVSNFSGSKIYRKLPSVNQLLFMDIPLLLEYGYDGFDEIWLVTVTEEIQLERLMARNHFTKEEAKKRIDAQMPLAQKRKFADRILDNSGSLEMLKKQIEEALLAVNREK
ncbi:dephospho-CoA kinase [Lactococcus kimchii]|uniref:dephospho-CoA kinase n=1 Tax=Lactococcus sp. S-13 TaxID=2507158 RepID=UPI001022FD9E|nr:dephospho-CoA kinase [Lactococcus sp. S-13]RZI48656.1 dephospho-CoA kinase [Lactococcus sp. S-13]